MKTTTIRRKIAVSVISLLIAFLVAEIAARVYVSALASDKRFLKFASRSQLAARSRMQRFRPHRYLGYVGMPDYTRGKNHHNSLGYRGAEFPLAKPEGEFRIVCMGGSTTYTPEVDDPELAYPALLEAELQARGHENVCVVNAGLPAWSSWETLLNFQLRILDLDPDLVIVYHGINEVPPRLVWPPEAYRGDNTGRRAPLVTDEGWLALAEHSAALRMLLVSTKRVSSHASLERTLDRPPPTYFAEEFDDQVREGTYPSGPLAESTAAAMLSANEPRFFSRNIENLVAIANHHGVRTLLATFASSPGFPEEPRTSSAEYLGAIEETNAILRRVATEQGASFFDFAAAFPDDERFFTDGCHVNEEGSRLKARLFADFLVESALLAR